MRCSYCKKSTVLEFKCRCDNIYCIKCRMPEVHKCTFNFIKYNKEIISNQNPVIKKSQINKI